MQQGANEDVRRLLWASRCDVDGGRARLVRAVVVAATKRDSAETGIKSNVGRGEGGVSRNKYEHRKFNG